MSRRPPAERRPQVSWRVTTAVGLLAVLISMACFGFIPWWFLITGFSVGFVLGAVRGHLRARRRARLLKQDPQAYLDEVNP